ncbi:hypothetical protein ACFFIY_09005 [Bhargavaea ullalensis]|uniref:Prepilin-type processing-associated H-X9-DG protein n=1 Tax=Bhargavaea ullalensis TaxID=1265685 RepID=A0ABV2GAA2_9BACL
MNQEFRVNYLFVDGNSSAYTFPVGETGVEELKAGLINGLFEKNGWISFEEPMTGNEVFINGRNVIKASALVIDMEMTSKEEE